MPEFILVCFASNDDNGHDTGKFQDVEIGDVGLNGLESHVTWITGNGPDGVMRQMLRVASGNSAWYCLSGPVSEWIGNMAWNGCNVTVDRARDLLRFLLWSGFEIEHCDLQGPLADIANGPEAEAASHA